MRKDEEVKIWMVSMDNNDIVRTSTVEDTYDWIDGVLKE